MLAAMPDSVVPALMGCLLAAGALLRFPRCAQGFREKVLGARQEYRLIRNNDQDDIESGSEVEDGGSDDVAGAPRKVPVAALVGLAVLAGTVFIPPSYSPWPSSLNHMVGRHRDNFRKSNFMLDTMWLLSDSSRQAIRNAERYYAQQAPLVRASADTFILHEYFAHTAAHIPSGRLSWYGMLMARLESIDSLRQLHGRDDYKIEKSKCDMLQFFIRNNVPMPEEVARWTDHEQFVAAVQGNEPKDWPYPVILKMCHLTQGCMKSTKMLMSHAELVDDMADIVHWVDSKWYVDANDYIRIWYEIGNRLTHGLRPGVVVQAGFPGPRKGKPPVELRVQVYWGHAVIANSDHLFGKSDENALVRRDGLIERYDVGTSQMTYLPVHGGATWLVDEGLHTCAFELSERVARLMGIEFVRVDVFVDRKTKTCVVNEISITDGKDYYMHAPFLAKLWAAPHLSGCINVRDPSQPVHLLDADAMSCHNCPADNTSRVCREVGAAPLVSAIGQSPT